MTQHSLVWRAVAEHRRAVYGLIAGFVINAVVFGLLVYPLRVDVATVGERTHAAEAALEDARADHTRATEALTGKDRAVKELDVFYNRVLAPDLAGARRLTYARLSDLASRSRLDYERGKYEPVVERGSRLTRLRVEMELTGSYAAIRSFIHALESAPEFVVIDGMSLTEGFEGDGALHLSLELSTYFRNQS